MKKIKKNIHRVSYFTQEEYAGECSRFQQSSVIIQMRLDGENLFCSSGIVECLQGLLSPTFILQLNGQNKNITFVTCLTNAFYCKEYKSCQYRFHNEDTCL